MASFASGLAHLIVVVQAFCAYRKSTVGGDSTMNDDAVAQSFINSAKSATSRSITLKVLKVAKRIPARLIIISDGRLVLGEGCFISFSAIVVPPCTGIVPLHVSTHSIFCIAGRHSQSVSSQGVQRIGSCYFG